MRELRELFRRALEKNTSKFGRSHPSVAVSLTNLAGLLESLHRYREAENLYLQAFAIWEKAPEPYVIDRANTLNNLAALYGSQGRIGQAIPLLQEALVIWEKAYSRTHPLTATGLANLAAAHGQAKQFDKAEPLLVEAIQIFEQFFPSDHPKLTWALSNYAYLLNQLERRTESKAVVTRVRRQRQLPAGFGEQVLSLRELLTLRK